MNVVEKKRRQRDVCERERGEGGGGRKDIGTEGEKDGERERRGVR